MSCRRNPMSSSDNETEKREKEKTGDFKCGSGGDFKCGSGMSVENVSEAVDIKTLKGIGPQNLGVPLEFSLSDLINNKIVDIDSTQVQYWVGSGHRQVCSKE